MPLVTGAAFSVVKKYLITKFKPMTKQEKIAALQKVIQRVDRISFFSYPYGLCELITDLSLIDKILTNDEWFFLESLIVKEHQIKQSDFIKFGGYLFTRGEVEPRRKWLQQQIDKLNQQ